MSGQPVIVAGAGIGGLAAALALARQGLEVIVLEQSPRLGEIGAGVQLGPNAFAAFDALGVGPRVRALAVYTERMLLLDAVDESPIVELPLDDAFRRRFGNPYAVIHRADAHGCLLEAARAQERIRLLTSARVEAVTQDEAGVVVLDASGQRHQGAALVGADGIRSAVRRQYVGDAERVSGHVVYRAVVDAAQFPEDLSLNAPVVWAGPDCHLVHYPLRKGGQYNVVLIFHSRHEEVFGVTDGTQEEVLSYFQGISERPRQLLHLPRNWRRWATADRDPIARWSFGRVTLLGDAAHPMLQYLAQGACMALEDAVTLGEAVRACPGQWPAALALYERSRAVRTARVVLSAREMGRVVHAKGIGRLVRNQLWTGRSPDRLYDGVEWLYGWTAASCLT